MPKRRETIASYHVMPKVLELLKTGEVSRAEITRAMEAAFAGGDLRYREQAVNWALTNLKKIGWASNPRRGVWTATTEGRSRRLTDDQAREIWSDLGRAT
jgi:hypothetical protein